MQNDTEQIARLKNTIEKVVGRKIEHPKDYIEKECRLATTFVVGKVASCGVLLNNKKLNCYE